MTPSTLQPIEHHCCHCHHEAASSIRARPWLAGLGGILIGEVLSGRRSPLGRLLTFVVTFSVLAGLALVALVAVVAIKGWPLIILGAVAWVTVRPVRRHRRRSAPGGAVVPIVRGHRA